KNTAPVPDGQMEGVTCATCHPSHTATAVLGRRRGIYQFGKDRNTPEAYKVIAQGAEDSLCMTCHLERHNVDNPVFSTMYQAGVRCIDCHQAVYGTVMNTTVPKREHDWKVAKNLPFSCGVEGSVVHCHPGFSVAGTLAFIPYIKQQHQGWPLPQGTSNKLARVNTQPTVADYTKLWQYLDAQARTQ
ncbi:MAG TPA: hypothetical protein VJX67_26455, partial [Blastocatellia bacterium]|nr:hypothetical protein [Blastocatellia bacterium]